MTNSELFERYRFRRSTIECIANGICQSYPSCKYCFFYSLWPRGLIWLSWVTTWEFQNLEQEGHAGKCGELFGGFSTMLYASRMEKELSKYREIQENRWYVFLFNFYEYIASHRQYLQCFTLSSFQRP